MSQITNGESGSSSRSKINAAIAQVDAWAAIKVFRAIVSQGGASPPTMTILENTLGGTPVWTRPFGAGVYHLTLTGAFPAAKTFVMMQGCLDATNTHIASARRGTDDLILVQTADTSGTGMDSLLLGDSLEILVYP